MGIYGVNDAICVRVVVGFRDGFRSIQPIPGLVHLLTDNPVMAGIFLFHVPRRIAHFILLSVVTLPPTHPPCQAKSYILANYFTGALHAIADRVTLPVMAPVQTPAPSLPYPLLARMVGCIWSSCPRCGAFGKYRLGLGQYHVRCVNRHCRQTWIIGLCFSQAAERQGESPETPRDMLFPPSHLNPVRWRSGCPVHKVKRR